MHEPIRQRAPEEKINRVQLDQWEEALLDLMGTASVTGEERHVAVLLESHLAKNFPEARIYRQHVTHDRWNVIMERGNPRLTLTSHIDVVPGGPPASYTQDSLYGRGACDAKGQIVAQLWGLQQAIAEGVSDYRCAYVIGEETDAAGARELLWKRLRHSEWREKSSPTEGLSLFVPAFAPEQDVDVRFASDCSIYAQGYSKVMLFGPGDISFAHTENERIERRELALAASLIAELIERVEVRERGSGMNTSETR